jgi:hypothetical protein
VPGLDPCHLCPFPLKWLYCERTPAAPCCGSDEAFGVLNGGVHLTAALALLRLVSGPW